METDFCKPKVINGVDLNLSFFFVTFLRGFLCDFPKHVYLK